KRFATLSSLVTSVAIGVAPHFSATAFKRSALREAITTSAPSFFASTAVARPMPDEPPTTTIFLPVSTIISPGVYPKRPREASSLENGIRLNLSTFEKRHGALENKRFEVRRLPMLKKCVLALILLVQQKFIWIVLGSVDGELQVPGLLT